ncbi:MAG: 3-dehydroquinate synthase [Eubacteriales bacterium]|nr:3-dehydroquinate synthase [Eubacteriales bacterium]
MPELIASTSSGDYPILIKNGALNLVGHLAAEAVVGRKAFVVSDETVYPLYYSQVAKSLESAGFSVAGYAFAAGEGSKTATTLFTLYEQFHQAGLSRSDLIIALGGGVVGDVTGFAAATYLRGVPLIQIPTTLLAQVDSSIGGKTAIDLPFGKNLAGAFYQPKAVVLDPLVLRTLSRARMSEGMAEVIKYGLIRDERLFDQIESQTYDLEWVLERCVRIKTTVVAADERDSGERMLLNFGHTVGHAIEKVTGYTTLTHGEAVAIGMMVASQIGEKLGKTPAGTTDRLRQVLSHYQLPTECTWSADELMPAIHSDKKRLAGKLYYILLNKIGEAVLNPMDANDLKRVLSEVLSRA